MTTKAQQSALDNALVAPKNQHVIGKCNMRINPEMKPKEPTYQVVFDALALATCYPSFLITAEVPVIYMHQFWATVNKHNASYRFKIDNKRFFVNVEVFRDILNICPRVPRQEFDEPPFEEEALSFIRKLGHYGEIKYINDIDNKDSKKQDKMFYPRFTKIIIHHFFEKDKSISMRNITFMHTARDDSLLGTMRFVSRHEDTQVYGVLLPKAMMNQAKLNSDSYKTYYAIASGAEPPKSKKPKRKSNSAISFEETPSKKKPTKSKKDVPPTKKPTTNPKPTKKKAPVKADKGKRFNVLSDLFEAAQLKKISGIEEGIGAKPGVPNVPKYDSESDKESWGDSEEEDDDDEHDTEDDDGNDDDDDSDHERTESDRDENPNLNQFNEEHEEEEEENVNEFTDKEDDVNNANDENEEELDDDEELYKDVNVNLRKEDVEMTDADQTVYDTQKTKGPMQSSSVSSDFTEVTKLKTDLSEMKQVDQYAQAISSIPTIVDRYINNKLGEAIHKEIQEEVKTQLPQILPKAVSDFSTHAIEKNVTESLEAAVLARSSSQPKSTYEVVASLSEYELTKILLDKMEEIKSHLRDGYKSELYDALVKSYNTDKDLIETYGEVFTLKRSRDEKDKDQVPSDGLDRGAKKRKSSKEAESQKDPRSKEGKSSRSFKYTSRSHHKSTGKSAHTEEPSHTVYDSGVQKNQEFNTGNNDEQLGDETTPKNDWFKKPERPLTPDPDWNKRQQVDFRPPQTWISVTARAEKHPTSFDKLMDTPIDFFAFVMNRLNITNLTMVVPAFNLLKGTYKSRTELEYHFEECSKYTTKRLDWHNPEGKPYPFDLRKPLPLIPDHRGRQVIPQDYFINNDPEYLKGGSLSRQYSTSITKTKAVTYEIKWIEEMVPNLWIPIKIIKRYDYGHLDEIEVRREDQHRYTFKEDERYDLNVALCMFTRRIVIQRRVEDLQLGIKSYQKKLNLTKPNIFRQDLKKRTAYTAYSNPQGVIYIDQNNKNRLMCTDELHKFSDGTLESVRTALYDTTSGIRIEYLPKKK
ncbi:hypothetical protein Tco_0573398 [Tanacetum coccineum]